MAWFKKLFKSKRLRFKISMGEMIVKPLTIELEASFENKTSKGRIETDSDEL